MTIIRELMTKKEIKEFILFPNKLYKKNPYYVPDMLASQMEDFDQSKNPAYEYCDTKCFAAYQKGKMVGRIAAIYNRKANEKNQLNQMRFWHVDFIDDDKVVDGLFGAVEGWAKEIGCTSVHGPLGFSDMDREGMLIEGFDRQSMFITYYNHPYYQLQMERLGYKKEVDWLEYLVKVGDKGDSRIKKLERIAAKVEKRSNLTQAPLTQKRDIRTYVEGVFELYNKVYVLFGMIPLTDRQIQRYVKEFLPLINPNTAIIYLNEEKQVVAFGVAAPSIARAMQKSGGRLFPFGWFHMLRALKGKNQLLDMFLIAVHPDYQGIGINAVILNKVLKYAEKKGIRYAETGPELETNADVQTQWRYFDTEQHKRRRCFKKEI